MNADDRALARQAACQALLREARAIEAAHGITPAGMDRMRQLVIGLAQQGDTLFPDADFAPPQAYGRNHLLDDTTDAQFALYLTVTLPGKESTPHDHGIWCVNAGLSGSELQRFYRRTDDGSRPGFGTVEEIDRAVVSSGTAIAMANHDIHATLTTGDRPSRSLALYGYALNRFPEVTFFLPEFGTVRTLPSRRPLVRA